MGQIQEVAEKWRKCSYTKSIPEELRKLCDLQRGIQTHHPWTGQHRAVRIRTIVQHHPMSFVPQTYAGRTQNSVYAEGASDPSKIQSEKLMHDQKPWLCNTTLPVLTVREANSAVMPHGKKDYWKAKDATRAANKNGHDTITIRWHKEGQFRESQSAHGWDEEYCKHLDYSKTIEIEHTATRKQRHRYKKYYHTGHDNERSSRRTHEKKKWLQTHY